MIRLVVRKTRSFLALPRFVRIWLGPVWLLLGVARLAVLTLSFRRITPYLGTDAGTAAIVPLLSVSDQARARAIGRTIRLAACYAPWDANCFAQAIVARVLLGLCRLHYTVFFGVDLDLDHPGALVAHAWTAADRVMVTGGNGFDRFTVVGSFTG